jgi:hypothetical protein
MVAVVDVEEEKKVSKFGEYKVVEGVIVRSSQVLVKAMWLQRLIGKALGSQSLARVGSCTVLYTYHGSICSGDGSGCRTETETLYWVQVHTASSPDPHFVIYLISSHQKTRKPVTDRAHTLRLKVLRQSLVGETPSGHKTACRAR